LHTFITADRLAVVAHFYNSRSPDSIRLHITEQRRITMREWKAVTQVNQIHQETETIPDCGTRNDSQTGIVLQGEKDRLHARNR
jgi:hypothetical protein